MTSRCSQQRPETEIEMDYKKNYTPWAGAKALEVKYED